MTSLILKRFPCFLIKDNHNEYISINLKVHKKPYLLSFINESDVYQVKDMICPCRKSIYKHYNSLEIVNIKKRNIKMRPNLNYDVEELNFNEILDLSLNNNFGIALAYNRYADDNEKYIFFSKVFEPETNTNDLIVQLKYLNIFHGEE
jgi:hypothetical protein